MKQSLKSAIACAKTVSGRIPDNKLKSYRAKLTRLLDARNYDKFCQTLLQLSEYSGVAFSFAVDLFEDFESNKDIAYTFTLYLNNYREGDKNNE